MGVAVYPSSETAVPFAEFYRRRCRWHLSGVGAGIPIGDQARIEQSFAAIPNTWMRCQIYEALDRCDETYAETRRALLGFVPTEAETYAGDVNRTVARSSRNPRKLEETMQIYKACVADLARKLWTPNWSDAGSDPFRYSRTAEGYPW